MGYGGVFGPFVVVISGASRKVTHLLRFRFDGDDHGWSTGGKSIGPGSQSESALLSERQQVELLRLVHDGLGRLMACAQLKVSQRTLKRTLEHSIQFRRALENMEEMRAENLYTILYTSALRGDTQAARFLLARHDRARIERG
jgi:hypothetical protein